MDVARRHRHTTSLPRPTRRQPAGVWSGLAGGRRRAVAGGGDGGGGGGGGREREGSYW